MPPALPLPAPARSVCTAPTSAAETPPPTAPAALGRIAASNCNCNCHGADGLLEAPLRIQTTVLEAAWRRAVRRLLVLGSSCIAPRLSGWGTVAPLRHGVALMIRERAEQGAGATGSQGEIHWDASKRDGTPKQQLTVGRLAALGEGFGAWCTRMLAGQLG